MINVAGHRLSTGQLEEVLQSHPNVAECAVVGVADALKGELPVGLVVLNRGVTDDDAARKFLSFFLPSFLPSFFFWSIESELRSGDRSCAFPSFFIPSFLHSFVPSLID